MQHGLQVIGQVVEVRARQSHALVAIPGRRDKVRANFSDQQLVVPKQGYDFGFKVMAPGTRSYPRRGHRFVLMVIETPRGPRVDIWGFDPKSRMGREAARNVTLSRAMSRVPIGPEVGAFRGAPMSPEEYVRTPGAVRSRELCGND